MIVFAIGDLSQVKKSKGDRSLGILGARVQNREVGIAVFKGEQQLMLHTGKRELKLRSDNDIDQYVSERCLRDPKLPRGHQ